MLVFASNIIKFLIIVTKFEIDTYAITTDQPDTPVYPTTQISSFLVACSSTSVSKTSERHSEIITLRHSWSPKDDSKQKT